VQRAVFAYSKQMQRGAFVDDAGEAHAYMPETYDQSGCLAAAAQTTSVA